VTTPDDDRIADVTDLEERLSRPTPEVVAAMGRLEGDLLILGVSGKIGPTLARMARRADAAAGRARRIVGVARFSNPELRTQLESYGIETIACDLLDRRPWAALPEVPNILYLPAMKFGSSGREATTWAVNAYMACLACERFPAARFAAYSTGNVYPLTPAGRGGSHETDPLGPVGEYAMSCLARERLFHFFSETRGTRVALLRLNYAHELRYGIMVDLAQKILAEQPVDVTMGYFNAVWQGDSNAMTLRALEHAASPPRVFNLAGPEELSVRRVAEQLGRRLGKSVALVGEESPDALLSNGHAAYPLLGSPAIPPEQMLRWIADWTVRGGATHGKPTHFQTRNGKF